MNVRPRHLVAVVAAAGALGASIAATPAGGQPSPPGSREPDRAFYILPPGNFGGLPTTDESRDQLPLYDALTPLRGDVTDADIEANFLPEDFAPVGATREEPTGRPGTRILYDEFGVAHIYGRTRADLAFGAGWVTARDRGLLIQLGRGPARAAVADIPGIDAFSLVTSGQSFVPSEATEQLVSDQVDLLIETYGDKGRQIIADAQAGADGVNAYWEAHGIDQPPATVNDVIATAAFIGSIFGAGGGDEASNAELLATLQEGLGPELGTQAWEDAMLSDDPEAPTTIKRRFNYGPRTGGKVTGSVVVDPGSVRSLDPRQPAAAAASTPASGAGQLDATYPAAGPVPSREASNFLLVDRKRSATDNTLAVMGPQLGYFYPEIVQQIHLSGPGIEAQGVAVPGITMYILIGRTQDYAWSLTSAGHDVRDVFAERLCNPDGTPPTRESTHYVFEGTCRPFEIFDAGTLNGTPIRYPRSVHGPVIGTATVDGEPYALTRKRSTFGRDGLNLAALKDMTEGRADTARRFFEAANQFEFTFNWAYASRTETAYFSSGLLPRRARGLDRRLPTLGTGEYEWRGFLRQRQHPHEVRGPGDLLLNWNNQSAPGFLHGDGGGFGSAHRVELFDQWPRHPTLADTVSVMNRAATEDVRSPVWPVVSRVLRTGPAPSALADRTVALLDDWVVRDAPRLDADLDGDYDDAGPVILDRLWRPVAEAVMRPVYGDLTDDLDDVRSLGGGAGQSYVDKDLRTLLGDRVKGRFKLSYCGNGSLDACRASLWAVVERVAGELAAEQGPEPSTWTGTADRTGFDPGLIPDTIRTTNRPTFQQVLELAHETSPGRRAGRSGPEIFTGDVEDFYVVPDPLPAGRPGELIRIQELGEANGRVTLRMMYHSRDAQDRDRAVTGIVTYPTAPAPKRGWPVISTAHGTTGLASQCAPSRFTSEAPGWGVDGVWVMTDYIGLGPVGEVHPFLSKTAEGHAVIDAVRAVSRLPDAHAGKRWVSIGHSQGGHGAIAAAELAHEHAPELELVGTVALAPGAMFDRVYGGIDPIVTTILTLMGLYGGASEHPDIDVTDYVTPAAHQVAASVFQTGCLDEITESLIPVAVAGPFTADPRTTEPARSIILGNDVGNVAVKKVPLFLASGTLDDRVVIDRVRDLFDRLCANGQVTEFVVVEGATHGSVIPLTSAQVTAFLEDRLARQEPVDSCPSAG